MADIFDFPRDARNVARADGKGADMGGEAPQTMLMRPQGVPDQVWNAVLSVDRMRRLKGMTYREIPVPNSMANFGIGVALECDETYASGWIMILYSLKFREDWHSHWRCVAFASLPLPDKEDDCLTPGMYWDMMMNVSIQTIPNMYPAPSQSPKTQHSAMTPTCPGWAARSGCLGLH